MRRTAVAVLIACAVWPAAAGASQALALSEVLAASSRHYPGILEALAERSGALGKVVEAEGAFDLVFDVDNFNRLSGFYDGRSVQAKANQPLRTWGGSLYGSYGLSRGDFPIYEDQYFTNDGGRLKLGVVFSLLRDRNIDERRFGITDARLALEAAELELLLTRIGVQQRATEAYWRWVAAGHQLGVYEDLLRIAEAREGGLETQVARGAVADINLTENRQNITRRRSLTVAAGADFRRAANALALYYRDADGEPLAPARERLPPAPSSAALESQVTPQPLEISAVVDSRPELRVLLTSIERARQRIALDENALRPKLDLSVEVGEPFGNVGVGGVSRDTTETVVGLTLSVPLQRRGARGALQQSRAELEAMRQQRRNLADQLELELVDVLLDLEVAQELAALAATEVEQANRLMEAERRRFESGASDFFLVNVREETAADARIRFLRAELTRQLALAGYHAATLNLERLGIETGN